MLYNIGHRGGGALPPLLNPRQFAIICVNPEVCIQIYKEPTVL